MSKVRLYGSTSGYIEVQAPAVASDSTVTLPNGPFDFEAGYRYAGTKYFTSDGTFAKADPLGTGDIGLRAIRVKMVGGGGGGGGSGTDKRGASGGGGGGYAESFITDIAGLAASVAVTIGSGGTGGAAGNNDGVTGGTTSFGSLLSALGGANGRHPDQDFPTGGRGGVSGTGNALNIGGNGGGAGIGVGTGNPAAGGHGGGSFYGGGARGVARRNGLTTNGEAGENYGGGGSGGVRYDTNNASGGAGANGIVIVDCYV